MKTKELFILLEQNKDKSLLFEYMPNALVAANYHITEVKHIQVDSVDCGGQIDAWNETIIQLWESPAEQDKKSFMSAFKALGILKKVGTIKPFDLETEVKFEYSNSHFNTAQLFVDDFLIENQTIKLKLAIQKTDCKAKEICGIESPKQNLESHFEACCTPDGNCC